MAYDVALQKQKVDAINYVQLKPDYEVINYKIKKDLKESVIKNQSKIWSPDIKSKYKSVETNSCYDMKNVVKKKPEEEVEVPEIEFVNDLDEVKKQKKTKNKKNKKKKTKNNDNDNCDDEKADVFIKTQKVIILPSISQKNIIQSWFSAYIDMYNVTIRFIKKLFNLSLLHKMKELKGYKLHLENKLKQLLKTRTNFEKVKKSLLKMMSPTKKTKKTKRNVDNTHIKLQYSECKKDIKDININISNTNNLIAQTTSKLNKYETKFKSVFNYKNLRTKYLKGIRNSIIKKHCYQNNEDNAIYVHIMDTSIKLA